MITKIFTVQDEFGDKLPMAEVKIGNTGTGVIANQFGVVTLSAFPNETVSIHHVGKQSKSFKVQDIPFIVTLTMDNLDEVTVVAPQTSAPKKTNYFKPIAIGIVTLFLFSALNGTPEEKGLNKPAKPKKKSKQKPKPIIL